MRHDARSISVSTAARRFIGIYICMYVFVYVYNDDMCIYIYISKTVYTVSKSPETPRVFLDLQKRQALCQGRLNREKEG